MNKIVPMHLLNGTYHLKKLRGYSEPLALLAATAALAASATVFGRNRCVLE